MSYTTTTDIKGAIDTDRLNQIAEDENKTVDEIVELAIDSADSIVNGKIQKVLTVPVTSPPEALNFLKEICIKLAKHWLYDRTHDIPEDVQKGFDWANKELCDIRDGKTTFEKASNPKPGVTVYNLYDQNVFQKGFLK